MTASACGKDLHVGVAGPKLVFPRPCYVQDVVIYLVPVPLSVNVTSQGAKAVLVQVRLVLRST